MLVQLDESTLSCHIFLPFCIYMHACSQDFNIYPFEEFWCVVHRTLIEFDLISAFAGSRIFKFCPQLMILMNLLNWLKICHIFYRLICSNRFNSCSKLKLCEKSVQMFLSRFYFFASYTNNKWTCPYILIPMHQAKQQ